jgi:hypothetical protein
MHYVQTLYVANNPKTGKIQQLFPLKIPVFVFDTLDGWVLIIFFQQNFQDIIFTPIRVDLNTQKWFRNHLKNHIFGAKPPISTYR